jgi:hypothetical protein
MTRAKRAGAFFLGGGGATYMKMAETGRDMQHVYHTFVYFLCRESRNFLFTTATLFCTPNMLRGLLIVQTVMADLLRQKSVG